MARRTGTTFRKEKENPRSRRQRWWIMGAYINDEGNFEIIRTSEPDYLKASENRCLVLHQADTETNPEALEIVNQGTGNAISVRTSPGGTVTGGIDADGNALVSSSEELKKNLKNMSDSVAEKQIKGLEPKTFTYIKSGKRSFGPTAENFNEITGLGDGTTISPLTLAGLNTRYIQLLLGRIETLEAKLSESDDSSPGE